MIVEYIRYEIDPNRGQEFEDAYRRAGDVLRGSEHCLDYEVSRCSEEPAQQIVRIEWDSTEGHLAGFRKSPEFPRFYQAIQPFVDDIKEMRHYEVILTGSPRQV